MSTDPRYPNVVHDEDGNAFYNDPATGELVPLPFLNELGQEVLDPVPMAPPIGYVKQPSLAEQIREMVRHERLQADLDAAGYETFEEADDFEVGDDYDYRTPYENDFDPSIKEMAAAGQAALDEKNRKPSGEDLQPEKPEDSKASDGKKGDPQPPVPEPKK